MLEPRNGPARMDPRLLMLSGQLLAGLSPVAIMGVGANDARRGKVEQRILAAVEHGAGDALADAPADETAASDLTPHPALTLKLLVGVGHRLHADIELLGEQALRRQALAVMQAAFFDIGGHCRD